MLEFPCGVFALTFVHEPTYAVHDSKYLKQMESYNAKYLTKAAFTLIYVLIIYISLVNKVVYK